ncbi:MAG: hypothetical protein IPP01_02625 [Saprospiraceae bacterium]|nr:hypothetical protein [Saprospiraceae bacterium]
MKKTFTLFFLLLCNMIGYKIIAQSEYQEARFNTSKETNFYAISENVKKVLLEKKSKAITPSEKNLLKKNLNNSVDGSIIGKILSIQMVAFQFTA